MKTLFLNLLKLVIAILLIACNTKESKKTEEIDSTIAKQNLLSNKSINENSITINGETYELVSDPCVSQINDDHSWLTFKAYNDDLDYTLTVVLMVIEGEINSGNYISSNGESQADSAIITFVTEQATYVFDDGFVNFTRNNNFGIVNASNLTLIDSFETLPNIKVNFSINCSL